MKKILIAIDDGPAAEKIAMAGFELGQQLNAEIALVSVVDTSALMTDGAVTPGELAGVIKNDLRNNQQLLAAKVPGIKLWHFIEEGKPYEKILKVASEWEADLIVLGTHARTGLTHFLLGSVAEKVIHHSVKPVFIIPIK